MADSFAQEHRAAAPLTPEPATLERVHDRARSLVTAPDRASRRARVRRVWPLAIRALAVAGAVALVAGAFAYVLAPHPGDSAFARDQAIAALVPKGCVLHTKSVSTYTDTFDKGTMVSTPTVGETWTDIERRVGRGEDHDSSTGELVGMSVRKGDWEKGLGRDAKLDEKTYKVIPLQWRLVENKMTDEMKSFTWLTDQLIEPIRSGKAKVTGRFDEDGQAYWVVEIGDFPGDESHTHVRAIMRVSDYGLKEFDVTREGGTGSSHYKSTSTTKYSVWETISRDKLPADFFSYDTPNKLAPKGTIIDPPRK